MSQLSFRGGNEKVKLDRLIAERGALMAEMTVSRKDSIQGQVEVQRLKIG